MNYHIISVNLQKLIKGKVSVENKDLEKVSKDASLFTMRPQIVIFPHDKYDVQQIVKYLKKVKEAKYENGKEQEFVNKLSITARAAGTDMSGGPLSDSIVLDFTKFMNTHGKIVHSKNGVEVSCEPGLYFRNLEKYISSKGYMYPSYPASKDLCAVGGIVANNSSGEKTLLYGSTKDWVSEVECVLSDGTLHSFKEITFSEFDKLVQREETPEIIRNIYLDISALIENDISEISKNKPIVSKNSSGYFLWEVINYENRTVNLAKLIIGSQGTLGIIVSVKLKLVAKKDYSQMLTVMLPDLDNLVPVVLDILKFKPEAVETFDDHTFKIAMKFLPSIIWKLKGSIFQLAFSFIPEAWMALTGGVPKLILMAEFTGLTQEEANRKAEQARISVAKFSYKSRVTKSKIDLEKYWLFRRESFNLLRSKLKGFRTAPFVEDVIVPLDTMPDFIKEMQNILDAANFTYTIAGHAGNGNFHIIPLMKLNTVDEIDLIKKTNTQVFSLIQKYHGSISAEHNDGLVRTPYLHFMFSDRMLDLFVRVKKIFDPLDIFNPGKKVGGSVIDNYKKIELTK